MWNTTLPRWTPGFESPWGRHDSNRRNHARVDLGSAMADRKKCLHTWITKMQSVQITEDNAELGALERSWVTAEYTSENGIGPMGSLHEAGNALVALVLIDDNGSTIIGSGVMVGPGLAIVATHVLEEFTQRGAMPVLLTFLPDGTRAWLARESSTASGSSAYGEDRRIVSDVTLISCTLNSHAISHRPLMLAPIRVALPLLGERLWAFGYRQNVLEDAAALITPLVTSGLVTTVYPHGRGERMPASCVEVDMDTQGGMSGGPVVNAAGELIGIVSSSIEGGPSYITLVWDALRFKIRSTLPSLAHRGDMDLMALRDLGMAKVKGEVIRTPCGDVTITLSKDESELMVASVDPSTIVQVPPGSSRLSKSALESLNEEWLSDLEEAAERAALSYLGELELQTVHNCLILSDIPNELASTIVAFTVEDFEGIEDIDVFSGLEAGDGTVALSVAFNLQTVVWTLEISTSEYLARTEAYNARFYNIQVDESITRIEFIQRFQFEASLTLDRKMGQVTQASITFSGVVLRRKDFP